MGRQKIKSAIIPGDMEHWLLRHKVRRTINLSETPIVCPTMHSGMQPLMPFSFVPCEELTYVIQGGIV
jgi:hypothetical protein